MPTELKEETSMKPASDFQAPAQKLQNGRGNQRLKPTEGNWESPTNARPPSKGAPQASISEEVFAYLTTVLPNREVPRGENRHTHSKRRLEIL